VILLVWLLSRGALNLRFIDARMALNHASFVKKFSTFLKSDSPSTSMMEQFQEQVSAALRPVFAGDMDLVVTAIRCRVCFK